MLRLVLCVTSRIFRDSDICSVHVQMDTHTTTVHLSGMPAQSASMPIARQKVIIEQIEASDYQQDRMNYRNGECICMGQKYYLFTDHEAQVL
jgi:hypothetical protein